MVPFPAGRLLPDPHHGQPFGQVQLGSRQAPTLHHPPLCRRRARPHPRPQRQVFRPAAG